MAASPFVDAGHDTTSLSQRPTWQMAPRAALQSRDSDTATRPEPLLWQSRGGCHKNLLQASDD